MLTSRNDTTVYTCDDYCLSVANIMVNRRCVKFDSGMIDLAIVHVAKEADNYVEYKSKPEQISSDQIKLHNAIVLLRIVEAILALDIQRDELEKLLSIMRKVKYLLKNNSISEFDLAECRDLLTNFKNISVPYQYELARENLKNAIDVSSDKAIADAANRILKDAAKLRSRHDVNIADVTSALVTSARVVELPCSDDAISQLQKQANHISQRSWGRMLAGSMLVLAGVAMAIGFTAVALISFGALAPVSILGFTLGVSMLAGGFAVAGGLVGLGGAAAGAGFFASGVRQGKETRQLRTDMEKLAKTAKQA